MSFHKMLCIDSAGHLDVYKKITHTMEWVYTLPLYASDVMLAIVTEAFNVESMLLTCVAERYYGVHNTFCFMETHFSFRWWVTKFL